MVGIIADLHDHLINFSEFIKKTSALNLEELWIAGDIGTVETVREVCENFLQPIRLVAGNLETGHQLRDYEALANKFAHLTWSSSELLTWTQAEVSVALFHFPRLAEQYAASHHPDLVVSGHTHQPTLKKIATTWHVNPGTLAGIFTPATYVIADLKTMQFTLKRLYV